MCLRRARARVREAENVGRSHGSIVQEAHSARLCLCDRPRGLVRGRAVCAAGVRYVHRKARMCMVLRLCPRKGGAPGEGTCRMRRMRRKHMSITGGTGSPAANSTPAHTYTFKHACVWHSRACSCAHMCMTPACMLLLASVPRGLEACRLFARDACTIHVCAQHAAHTPAHCRDRR